MLKIEEIESRSGDPTNRSGSYISTTVPVSDIHPETRSMVNYAKSGRAIGNPSQPNTSTWP
jgi:hypothetical protein